MALAKTFCSAPWFQTRIDWDGQYRPCCGLKENLSKFAGRTQYSIKDTTVDEWMSSDYARYLRQELSSGTALPECDNCWQKEKNSVKSYRQESNDAVTNNHGYDLDNTWVKLFVDRNLDYHDYRIMSADVKLSNVCNFTCAMCGPHNSSKVYDRWQNNLDNKFVQEQLQHQPALFKEIVANYQTKRGYQHLLDILAQPLRFLKVLGGEPLLDKDLFRILQDQPADKKSQIHVEMVTNGSQDLVAAADRLQGYKSVSFTISLEGIGAIQDYVRNGSDWPVIEQNILNAKQHGWQVNIHHTIQAMTVLNLHELLSWCHANEISISFGVLDYPEYLSVSVLPDSIYTKVIDSLACMRNIDIINSINDDELVSVDNIINLIDQLPRTPEKYTKFLEYVKWFDQNSAQPLQHIQPGVIEKIN